MSTTMMMENLTMEVEFAECDCCGLTEECTPEYMERIRERYQGKWICGLCGEAVKDEIMRSENQISAEEAMTRHMTFRRAARSLGPPTNPAVLLIAAMKQVIRRSLDSPRPLRSMPCCPREKTGFVRPESCIPTLTLTVESPSYCESEEPGEW